jgi:hypothetical protein
MKDDSEVVARRTTFDGVTILIHADGRLSDRLRWVPGGKVPVDRLFRFADDIGTFNYAELPDAIRAAKRKGWYARRNPMAPIDDSRMLWIGLGLVGAAIGLAALVVANKKPAALASTS